MSTLWSPTQWKLKGWANKVQFIIPKNKFKLLNFLTSVDRNHPTPTTPSYVTHFSSTPPPPSPTFVWTQPPVNVRWVPDPKSNSTGRYFVSSQELGGKEWGRVSTDWKTMEQNSEEMSNIETVSYKKIVSINIFYPTTYFYQASDRIINWYSRWKPFRIIKKAFIWLSRLQFRHRDIF